MKETRKMAKSGQKESLEKEYKGKRLEEKRKARRKELLEKIV